MSLLFLVGLTFVDVCSILGYSTHNLKLSNNSKWQCSPENVEDDSEQATDCVLLTVITVNNEYREQDTQPSEYPQYRD